MLPQDRPTMQPFEAFAQMKELGYIEDESAGTGGLACWVLDERHRTFITRYKAVPAALIRLARKHALEKGLEGLKVLDEEPIASPAVDQDRSQLFLSCPCPESKWVCMSKDPKWGLGVFSWHKTETAARWNAEIIGGWAIPAGRDGSIAHAVAERLSFYTE